MAGRERNLAVDEIVIKASAPGVLRGASVIVFERPGPIYGAQTHGAGLAGAEKFAIGQLKRAEFAACRANGHHFCMSCGIVIGCDRVDAGRDQLTVAYDERTKGAAVARLHVFDGKLNCLFYPALRRCLLQNESSIATPIEARRQSDQSKVNYSANSD